MNIFVSWGCGFIGSHLIRMLMSEEMVNSISNVNRLTYDEISIGEKVRGIIRRNDIGCIINLAAKSQVDNPIDWHIAKRDV